MSDSDELSMDKVTFDYLRTLPDRSLTRAEVNLLIDYAEKLERMLDGAQLAYIEASNPGIDMDDVRRIRAGGDDQVRSS